MTFLPLPSNQRHDPLPWPLVILLILNILPEMAFQMVEHGIAGVPPFLRSLAYLLGAFQPDLGTQTGPYYPGQSVVMFFTYGFLHTGLWHLVVNMIGLVWLGRMILSYRTSETFVMFYLMSMVGAAECAALLQTGSSVVGASGALFGLLGVYAVDQGLFTPRSEKAFPVAVQLSRLGLGTLAVVLSDVASQALLGTAVAWQAHAGGFVTGALLAVALPPRAWTTS